MTGTSTGLTSEPGRTLGEVLHRARVAGGEQRPRPWPPESWADLTLSCEPWTRRLAAAVEAAVLDRLARAAPGGELVRQTWVYWALEQPDVAEHPNWVKSWAEIDERDREA